MKLLKHHYRKCRDKKEFFSVLTNWEKRRKNKRNRYNVYIMTKTLMKKHNISNDWEILIIDNVVNGHKDSLAATYHEQKIVAFRTDFALKGDKEDLKGVILHEIAHILAGRRSYHNRYWEKIAYEIGAIVNGIVKDKFDI